MNNELQQPHDTLISFYFYFQVLLTCNIDKQRLTFRINSMISFL